ncbi:MAG: nitronate monooxygenase [Chloroflexi bacterium]|jgi:NADH:quinone reductase (non-electrogenic)|nr:nitronate monooxygenase [Chloroflexota bacterium]
MWQTKITEMFGIEYPIIQGAFGTFGTAEFAVPVSEAGGLGMITAGGFGTPENFREELKKAKSMTDKPLAVNLTIMGCPEIEAMRDVIIEEGGIVAVETAPMRADFLGKPLQEHGIKWIHKVASVNHALAAERQGADAVVIVGLEGAGFKSMDQLTTMIAIPWASKLLKIPVIAAGGMADARGFMAALMMGAEAVYMGTAFMATKECPISEKHKKYLAETDPTEPKLRERCLTPPNMDEVAKVLSQRDSMPEHEWLWKLEKAMVNDDQVVSLEGASEEEVEMEVLRSVPGSLAVGAIDSIPSIKEFMEKLISEAEAIRRRWSIC